MKNAFIIAGLFGAISFLVVHPASAEVCGCTSHYGVWRCYPSVTWCNDQCRDDYKLYSDRTSCFNRGQSQKPARKTTKAKKKS